MGVHNEAFFMIVHWFLMIFESACVDTYVGFARFEKYSGHEIFGHWLFKPAINQIFAIVEFKGKLIHSNEWVT